LAKIGSSASKQNNIILFSVIINLFAIEWLMMQLRKSLFDVFNLYEPIFCFTNSVLRIHVSCTCDT
ncbi:hypothetical protein ACJX0J_007452, partial [Zea mays]